MTEKDLEKIFAESKKELLKSIDAETLMNQLKATNGSKELDTATLFSNMILLGIEINQKFLFKVLSKALCKD